MRMSHPLFQCRPLQIGPGNLGNVWTRLQKGPESHECQIVKHQHEGGSLKRNFVSLSHLSNPVDATLWSETHTLTFGQHRNHFNYEIKCHYR
jgi:hypothetical protein